MNYIKQNFQIITVVLLLLIFIMTLLKSSGDVDKSIYFQRKQHTETLNEISKLNAKIDTLSKQNDELKSAVNTYKEAAHKTLLYNLKIYDELGRLISKTEK